MARGDNFRMDNNINMTPDDNSRLTQFALKVFQIETPNLHDPEDVQRAILEYFRLCDEHHTRPGNLGLYAAVGMTRQDFFDVKNGRNKSKISPEAFDIVKKAARTIGVYRENLAAEGKINPVTYIFMSKNFDGLRDQAEITVSAADQADQPRLSPAEVAKQIEQDIPIDAEYRDITPKE